MDPDLDPHLVFRLDPDPHKTDADPKHWTRGWFRCRNHTKISVKNHARADAPETEQIFGPVC